MTNPGDAISKLIHFLLAEKIVNLAVHQQISGPGFPLELNVV